MICIDWYVCQCINPNLLKRFRVCKEIKEKQEEFCYNKFEIHLLQENEDV